MVLPPVHVGFVSNDVLFSIPPLSDLLLCSSCSISSVASRSLSIEGLVTAYSIFSDDLFIFSASMLIIFSLCKTPASDAKQKFSALSEKLF
jgi:hypothetical protein